METKKQKPKPLGNFKKSNQNLIQRKNQNHSLYQEFQKRAIPIMLHTKTCYQNCIFHWFITYKKNENKLLKAVNSKWKKKTAWKSELRRGEGGIKKEKERSRLKRYI